MTPDDFRAWVPVAATIAGWVGIIATMIYRKGAAEKQVEKDREINTGEHITLDKRVTAIGRKVDDHERRVTVLEADGKHIAGLLQNSMLSLQGALGETNRRIDALLQQLSKGA